MKDEDRSVADSRGVESDDNDPFFAKLHADAARRRQYAESLTREASQRPSAENMLEVQRKHAAQLARLDHSLSRLRRSVLVANVCAGTVAVAFLALAAYVAVDPLNQFDLTLHGTSDRAEASLQESPRRGIGTPELLLESEYRFVIRTDTDRKYQLIIRELLRRASSFRLPGNEPTEVRAVKTNDYIQFMTDVTRAIEQAANDQVSPEITEALVNLAMLGQAMRRIEYISDLDVEMQNKRDQIRDVLLAPDARSSYREP